VPAVTAADLILPPPAEGSGEVAARVAAARDRQARRYAAIGLSEVATNAACPAAALEEVAQSDGDGLALIHDPADSMRLSARGFHRVLKVARTLADLDDEDNAAAAPCRSPLLPLTLRPAGRGRVIPTHLRGEDVTPPEGCDTRYAANIGWIVVRIRRVRPKQPAPLGGVLQKPLDRRNQLAVIEGFCHGRIGLLAGKPEGLFSGKVRTTARDGQDLGVAAHGLQKGQHVTAVLVRHDHVRDHEVEMLLLEQRNSRLAARGFRDRMTSPGQDGPDRATDKIHIIYQENMGHSHKSYNAAATQPKEIAHLFLMNS
jgi:hypothetical protein